MVQPSILNWAPTYTLYLAARHVLSVNYRPGLSASDRSRLLAGITKRIASSVQQTIQVGIAPLHVF